MRKRPLTSFGVAIKTKLIERGETQNWLIQQLQEKTGQYIDVSLMYKITVGSNSNPKLTNAIKEILQID